MKSISLNTKILILTLGPFIIFNSLFLVSSYFSTKDALILEKRQEISDVLDSALGVLDALDKRVKSKGMTLKEAQILASEYLTNMRYGKNGDDYVWVNDFVPNMVVHPKKSLVGKSLSAFKDKAGKPLFNDIVALAKAQDKGYINYLWTDKSDPTKFSPKLSYIHSFKPWGWILGTGIYLNDVNDYIFNLMVKSILTTIAGLTFMALLITFSIRKGISNPLLKIAEQLRATSLEVTNGATETKHTSEFLSQMTHDQASSLQETVSSIDEISAMINRNTDSAQESKVTSEQSKKVATSGKVTVDEMLSSIGDITESNTNVMKNMEDSNSQISEILTVIREIEDKTKVINDIVFQTKLLSFNASVEAARAGESGKGFSVVAEEVGNLANMSGVASEEIKSLIDQSIKRVEEIVSNTTGMVDKLIVEGKSTVDKGTQKANECKEALDEILQNIDQVNVKVIEISDACGEQSAGVTEITKAMQMLDQLTHKNSEAANQASDAADTLEIQAENLDSAVGSVIELVNGKSNLS